VKNSLSGYVAETGLPVRLGNIEDAPRFFALIPGVRSELTVPLKYAANIIGVLDLESTETNAFSDRDEQLLVLMASYIAGLIENVRLHEETRGRARNLELIHEVVERVVGLTDVATIAQEAAELMAERFAYELAVVNLLDEQGIYLEAEGIGGAKASVLHRGYRQSIDEGVMGRVFNTGKSEIINDTSLDQDYLDYAQWRAGSELCTPLREGEHIFGVVNVEREHQDSFSKNDLLALEALAGVLSTVIINAHRYQQLRDNFRRLQAVRETALDISADLDLDTVLRRVTKRAQELIGAKGAELGLVNNEQQVVEIKVSENPWEGYSKELTIPFSQGVAGQMAVLGKPLVIEDYNSWEHRLFPEREPPFTAVAGVPLKFRGQVIGTLTISHDEAGRGFDPEDMQLLELLAPQVAVSVRNASLYQELQKLMEAERIAKDRLIRSARLAAVGEMAAGVAHELNNPLTTVAGFVELVLEDLEEDSPQRTDLELVLREARRAREVVRRLLDFSRPGEGFRVRSDLNELINEVIALVQHLAHTSGVEIVTKLWDELPWIHIDRDQIKQVLLNLVHNALQAMPSGGILRVRTKPRQREKQAWVTVEVEDNGQGISTEDLGRIFEPFFTTRPPGRGTGLGLSVSYGIITDHGGFIEVQSQLSQGSHFTVWLPLQSQRALL
jgi:two-component system NtrC family sensor kinase